MFLDCTHTPGQTGPSVSQGTLRWWLQLGRRLWEEEGEGETEGKGRGEGRRIGEGVGEESGRREGRIEEREGRGKRRAWGECI